MDEYREPTEEEMKEAMELQEYYVAEEEKKPKLLFKYRKVDSAEDLARVMDIFKNNRLYMPRVCELNDPFEGGNVDCLSQEKNNKLRELRETYRVLSLSADCFAPTLWAYYAQEGAGLCIGFYRQGSFCRAQPVEYKETVNKQQDLCFEAADALSHEYLCKNQAWSHEKEYRIGREEGDAYFKFKDTEFACLILGKRMNCEVRKAILEVANLKVIPTFKLDTDLESARYFLKRLDDEKQQIYEIGDLLAAIQEDKS